MGLHSFLLLLETTCIGGFQAIPRDFNTKADAEQLVRSFCVNALHVH